MLIAQTDGLELLPDPFELIWGVMAVLLLVVPLPVAVALVVWVKRAADRRKDLQARVERLEEGILEARDPKR